MPRRSTKPPDNAITITTYEELEECISAFTSGHFALLVILGRPGLSKSQSLKRATDDTHTLVVKGGRKTPFSLYCDLWRYQDQPVILDDADDLWSDKLSRQIVKCLTETDAHKRLEWGSSVIKDHDVPKFFFTESPCCVITNSWGNDAIYKALESRAEFIHFDPSWTEVYRQAAKWYWDQEIFDYVHSKLDQLKEPDVRLLVKASQRKDAGLQRMCWRRLIDSYCDDDVGQLVRQLIDDDSFPTNVARAEAFVEQSGKDRATFYRRMARIKHYRPSSKVRRLKCGNERPIEERPPDAFVEVVDDEDE